MKHAVVTGVGLLASKGEMGEIGGYPFFKHEAVEFDKQIPKKSDQRQMDAWQRIGVYAAGLALDQASVKTHPELLSKMHIIVAAGGGERDTNADSLILNGLRESKNEGAYLNEKLLTELRPTLFLSQLSNLLAGNISIVHGVIGSSRTFMGEELAGVDAVRIAVDRIKASQGEIFLVGGSYSADRADIIMHYVTNGQLEKGDKQGMKLGSVGAFLVIEERDHAIARGAKILAEITSVHSNNLARDAGDVAKALDDLYHKSGVLKTTKVISTNSQAPLYTANERVYFKDSALLESASRIGHSMEASFPAAIALALEELDQYGSLVVAGLGHIYGAGLAHLKAETNA